MFIFLANEHVLGSAVFKWVTSAARVLCNGATQVCFLTWLQFIRLCYKLLNTATLFNTEYGCNETVEKLSLPWQQVLASGYQGESDLSLFFMDETKEYFGFYQSPWICCRLCCCTRNGEIGKMTSVQTAITSAERRYVSICSSNVFPLTLPHRSHKPPQVTRTLWEFSAGFAHFGEFITIFQHTHTQKKKQLTSVGTETWINVP